MDGLLFKYRSITGAKTPITFEEPQYLFLEPLERVVIRYYLTKDGLEDDSTYISKQAVDTDIISVKMRFTTQKLLSKISDFKEEPAGPITSEEIEFEEDTQEVFLDVLYESLIDRRLKVRVKTMAERNESFENENTHSDGPDEFVRIADVQVKHDAVYFAYIYRRSGRLKKFVGKASYTDLAQILKDRVYGGYEHVDSRFPRARLEAAMKDLKWVVDYENKEIYKLSNNRRLVISDDEVASLIRSEASTAELLGLLSTYDLSKSKHALRSTAEDHLVACDRVCSLPAASIANIIDTRGG